MVKEGTPGKYQLRAVVPGSRRPLLESHATRDEARRRAKLERAEYTVMVTVDETVPEGWEHPTGADKAGWWEDGRIEPRSVLPNELKLVLKHQLSQVHQCLPNGGRERARESITVSNLTLPIDVETAGAWRPLA
jgi:hypothetical protein